MPDIRDLLEQAGERVPMPEPAFERILRRRERKRRVQRVTALAMGIGIALALGVGLVSALPREAPSPLQTPSPTLVDDAAPIDLLPPAGSELTRGGTGALVFWYRGGLSKGTTQWLFLYQDGRLISNVGPYDSTLELRWVERRLTPEGVELMNEALEAADLPTDGRQILVPGSQGWHRFSAAPGYDQEVAWGPRTWVSDPDVVAGPEASAALIELGDRLDDPGAWLPPSAWERAEPVRFAPATYLITVEALNEKVAAAAWLSDQRAVDDLPTPLGVPLPAVGGCAPVGLDAARSLAAALDDAGVRFDWDTYIGLESESGVGMVWPALSGGRPVVIRIAIPLPHESCGVRPDR